MNFLFDLMVVEYAAGLLLWAVACVLALAIFWINPKDEE